MMRSGGFAMFSKFEARLERNGENLRKMMERMKFDPLRAGEVPYAFSDAVRRCAYCRETVGCSRWLEEAEPEAPPPSFCPNAFFWRAD
jgi:hypothetical protein